MISLNVETADTFVNKHKSRGVDVSWHGWDIVFHTPEPAAANSKDGRFSRLTNSWGRETIISPNSNGDWLVNYKLTQSGRNGRR